jgi:hypothetical protein
VLGEVHSQPVQREQVQPSDDRERIEVQGWATFELATMISWRRDRNRVFMGAGTMG